MDADQIKAARDILKDINKDVAPEVSGWRHSCTRAEQFIVAACTMWPQALDECERLQKLIIPDMDNLRVWQQSQDDYRELVKLRAENAILKEQRASDVADDIGNLIALGIENDNLRIENTRLKASLEDAERAIKCELGDGNF